MPVKKRKISSRTKRHLKTLAICTTRKKTSPQRKGVRMSDHPESKLITQLKACAVARVNALLIGRPGIGKSRLAHLVANGLFSGKVYAIVLPEDTPVAELRGHFLPVGDKWVWHDGPVTRAIREGAACILDELSHLSPEAQTFMHAAMDDSPITLPTGETIHKTAKPWFIATQNDDAEALRPALKDRFPVVLTVKQPVEEAYLGLPVDLQAVAKRDVTGNNASLRPWYAFAELKASCDSVEEAAELIWPSRGKQMAEALKLAA